MGGLGLNGGFAAWRGDGGVDRTLLGGVTVARCPCASRPAPQVHGSDYYFCDMAGFREEAAAGRLLEHAPVPSAFAGTHLYGSSFATVREVAVTGKLALMGLDVQVGGGGAAGLGVPRHATRTGLGVP